MVLAEIYILFNLVAFAFFVIGVEKKNILYPMVSMVIFFALAAGGFSITSIFTADAVYSIEAVGINFMFAFLSLVFMFVTIFEGFKTNREDEDED